MMSAEINSTPPFTVISAYAPHALRPAQEKEEFYTALTQLVGEARKRGPAIVAGDFNARIAHRHDGEEEQVGQYPGVYHHNLELTRLLG